jgi:hypothetical protein
LSQQGGEANISNSLRTRKAVEALVREAKITDGEWIDPNQPLPEVEENKSEEGKKETKAEKSSESKQESKEKKPKADKKKTETKEPKKKAAKKE